MSTCPDLPLFHIALHNGWINDPNGPFFYKGLWHLFYQYLPGSSKWDFGLQWGHAVSKDMVHWQLLPPAIVPTPGSADQDGAFSGCACIDEETGLPMLLYTGVRQRASPTCGPLPPAPFDLNLPIIESQLIAWPADKDDPLLQVWCKGSVPLVALPPANMDLAGWRDPFITATPSTSADGKYTMLIGGGIKNGAGLIHVYKSKHLTRGWEHAGFLCEGEPGPAGVMWECPLLARLQPGVSEAVAALGMQKSRAVAAAPNAGAAAAGLLQQPLPSTGDGNSGMQARCGQPDDQASVPAQLLAGAACSGEAGLELGPADGLLSNGACHCPGANSLAAPCGPDSSPPSPEPASALQPTAVAASLAPAKNPSAVLLEPEEGPGAAPHDPSLKHVFFCISPDACTFPVLYWLGSCPLADRFHIEGALGPFYLDLGDALYAPNLVKDPLGRTILVAWVQDKRVVGEYAYAGAMSAARILTLDCSDPQRPYLVQQPLPELKKLRINHKQADVAAPNLLLPGHVPAADGLLSSHHVSVLGKAAGPEDASEAARRHGSKRLGDDGFDFTSPCLQQHGSNDGSSDDTADGPLQAAPAAAADGSSEACSLPDASQRDQGRPAASLGLEGHPDGQAVDALAAGMARLGGHSAVLVGAGESVPITGVAGACLDIEISFLPVNRRQGLLQRKAAAGEDGQPAGLAAGGGSGSVEAEEEQGLRSGLALRAWASSQGGSAAVLYDWRSGVLEVVFAAVDQDTHQFSLAAPDCRRVGGKLQRPPAPGEALHLRLLVDASLLEVFTGSGEVLSTRFYRGQPLWRDGAQPAMSGIDVISVGGTTSVIHFEAYEMSACWEDISF